MKRPKKTTRKTPIDVKLTDAVKARILQLHREGKSLRDIAGEVRLSKSYIHKVLSSTTTEESSEMIEQHEYDHDEDQAVGPPMTASMKKALERAVLGKKGPPPKPARARELLLWFVDHHRHSLKGKVCEAFDRPYTEQEQFWWAAGRLLGGASYGDYSKADYKFLADVHTGHLEVTRATVMTAGLSSTPANVEVGSESPLMAAVAEVSI